MLAEGKSRLLVSEPASTPLSVTRRRRWLRGGLALLLVLGLVGAAAFAWHRFHLHAAQEALARYDLDAAQQQLADCLRVWPMDRDVCFLAARTARRRGAYDEAESYLAACRKLHYSADALALEGVLASVQQGKLGGSEELVRDLLRREHRDAVYLLEALGTGYSKAKRFRDARATLTQLLLREPDHVPALLLRAGCFLQMIQPELAAADLIRALDLAPDRDGARTTLAATLAYLGQTGAAAEQYECLRRRRPDDADVLVRLAVCRQDLTQLDEAQVVLDDLLARHPDHVAGLVERGRVAFRLGDAAEGERWARRAEKLDAYNAKAPLVLALCLEAQGKLREAEACQERARQLEADTSGLSVVAHQLNDSPRAPALHCRLGGMLLRLGREQEGIDALERALKCEADYAPAHRALADYYERTGRTSLAAPHRQATDTAR
jgi:predicted Zn-dependent protease